MDEKEITEAYYKLQDATQFLYQAGEQVINARVAFETAKADKTASGEIAGKNEDERKASARKVLENEYRELSTCESIERSWRFQCDMASLEVKRVEAVLHLMDIYKV